MGVKACQTFETVSQCLKLKVNRMKDVKKIPKEILEAFLREGAEHRNFYIELNRVAGIKNKMQVCVQFVSEGRVFELAFNIIGLHQGVIDELDHGDILVRGKVESVVAGISSDNYEHNFRLKGKEIKEVRI